MPDPTATAAARPSGPSLLWRQFRAQNKLFLRNPFSAFFSLAFPVMFLLLFGSLNGSGRIPELNNIRYIQFLAPGMLAFAVISTCYTGLVTGVAINRDEGLLKRVRGTPVPTWAYLAGQVASSIVVTFVLFFLTVGLGVVAFGVEFRTATAAGLFVTLALGAACFCALGLAVSGLCPNADAAPAIVNFSIFPLLFVSGIFFPLDDAPGWLTSVAKLFPMQQLADGLQYAFDPRTTGLGFNGTDLWSLLAWTVAGALLAVRLFRWDSPTK